MPYLLFLKKWQNLKLSSAANYRLRSYLGTVPHYLVGIYLWLVPGVLWCLGLEPGTDTVSSVRIKCLSLDPDIVSENMNIAN